MEPPNLRRCFFAILIVLRAHLSVPDDGIQRRLELRAHRLEVLALLSDLRLRSQRRFVFRQVHDPTTTRDVQQGAAKLGKRVADGVPEVQPRLVYIPRRVEEIGNREYAPRKHVEHRERVSEFRILSNPRHGAVHGGAREAPGEVRDDVHKRHHPDDQRPVPYPGRDGRQVGDETPAE